MQRTLSDFPWIVSCDTLKTEDLLVKFWSAAEQAAQIMTPGLPFAANHRSIAASLEHFVGEDSNADHWDDEAAAQLLDDVAEALQGYAPVGFYFGASVGDGACFGFWLTDDWCEVMETLGFQDDDPTGWASLIAELDNDGIDPENFQDSYQGKTEGIDEDRAGAEYAQRLAEEMDPGFDLDRTGSIPWPHRHVDWAAAWEELRVGDGYRLHSIGGGDWLVFRAV